MADFVLSAQLCGHASDVRAVEFPQPDLVVSASRDFTARVWRRIPSTTPQFDGDTISDARVFINSTAYLPPTSPTYPVGLIALGSQDGLIAVVKPDAVPSANAERLLIGHSNNVCALDVGPDNAYLISGSWDCEARIWSLDDGQTFARLLGHEQAVWAVLAFDTHLAITGCADQKIRLFNLDKHSRGEVYPTGSVDTGSIVRTLCRLTSPHPSGADFASAGNDGVIRLWTLTGRAVGELHGHDNFIYSLISLPSGELVSSGEDHTVRIWRASECVQVILHPAISVWTVAACAHTGDIVSGASDAVVRIFTRHPERMADAKAQADYNKAVQLSTVSQQQSQQQINRDKLDGPEALTTSRGKKDGEIKMIRENDGSVGAYQWSADQWVHLGTVVDAAAAAASTGPPKKEFHGQMYDYVFDVDIADGLPTLKLPYNLAEDPLDRATQFVAANQLPLSYIGQVADFIRQSAPGAGTDGQALTSQPTASPRRFLPHLEFLTLCDINPEPVQHKILALNDELCSTGHEDMALSAGDESLLNDLCAAVAARDSNSVNLPPLELSQDDIALVMTLASQWDRARRLPGLDLLRCIARSQDVVAYDGGCIIRVAFEAALPADGEPAPPGTDHLAMMAFRVVTNVFASGAGRDLAMHEMERVVNAMERVTGLPENTTRIGKFHRNLLIALTSAAFNYACLAYRLQKEMTDGDGVDVDLLTLMANVLGKVMCEPQDPEVLYRAVMSFGMILLMGGDICETLTVMGGQDWIQTVIDGATEDRLRNAALEVQSYLHKE